MGATSCVELDLPLEMTFFCAVVREVRVTACSASFNVASEIAIWGKYIKRTKPQC